MGAKNSKLGPNDLMELAHNTDFSKSEIQLWYKSFKKDCPAGKLTQEEFRKLYKKFFPNGDATAFATHAFRTFDNNGDGAIDFREFMCALSVTSRGSFEKKLEWAFSMYDQDKDGNVTKTEMLEIMNAIYKMVGKDTMSQIVSDGLSAEERVDKLFTKIDKDNDAKITIEEFLKAAKEDSNLLKLLQVGGGASA